MKGNVCPSCDSSYLWKYKRGKKYHCYTCGAEFTKPKIRVLKDIITKKRNPQNMPLISRTQILRIIKSIDGRNKDRDCALFAALFLTGARASELVKTKAEQYEKEIIKGQEFLVVRNVIILKKRKGKREYRDIYIHYITEKPFVDVLTNYLNSCYDKERPFPFHRKTVWSIINRWTKGKFDMDSLERGLFPHYFRTVRSTDLLNTYENFKVEDLLVFHGWSDLSPAMIYVKRAAKDVARRMVSKFSKPGRMDY